MTIAEIIYKTSLNQNDAKHKCNKLSCEISWCHRGNVNKPIYHSPSPALWSPKSRNLWEKGSIVVLEGKDNEQPCFVFQSLNHLWCIRNNMFFLHIWLYTFISPSDFWHLWCLVQNGDMGKSYSKQNCNFMQRYFQQFGSILHAYILHWNCLLNIAQTTQYCLYIVYLTSFSRNSCQEIVWLYFYQGIWKRCINISAGIYVVKVLQLELICSKM